ncbi:3-oxoacid CoA-transferase subunit B [Neobacillus sp. NPDC093182]|uniref:3-oxoacid CoA-transferase subunit B n=1 Tax=Neobacillus sp. NPDC093182 TaxID=3364297 RepID=UPI00382FEF59
MTQTKQVKSETKQVKERIARKAAEFLKRNQVVNLGIGIPTIIADIVPQGIIFMHTENGMLGVGPTPNPGEEDKQIINAGKKHITETIGCSYFDSAQSFAMIRGGHIDTAVLGALQISEKGDIANWAAPGKAVLGVGGAMDLVVGAKKVIVTTTHLTREGNPKILSKCDYPLTAEQEVDILITEFAVFCFDEAGMVLCEISSDITLEELKEITPANYRVSDHLKIW